MGSPLLHAQDAKAIVQKAVDTEIAADRADRSRWLYKDHYKSDTSDIVQWVAETNTGALHRVLFRNGQAVDAATAQREMESFVQDARLQEKKRADGKKDDEQAEQMMRLLPVGFLWTITSQNGTLTRLHFKPDPNFTPPTRESRVFAGMEGDLTVQNQQSRIVSLHGRLVNDVTFGFGLFGRLKAGGTFSVDRKEMQPKLWLITETHVHIEGHILLFKSISEQEDEVKTEMERLPDTLSLQDAEKMLLQKK